MSDELKAVFQKAVQTRVEANGRSGWGGEDSLKVIEELADAAYSNDEGFDGIRSWVASLVNPSAFRQVLEGLPEGHPRKLKATEKKTRKTVAADL